ncbi:MAG: hypothetical protein LC732_12795 [Acidobacteria bacterium]|nr:hypothetical protein [Acidobacteriota bacterium]
MKLKLFIAMLTVSVLIGCTRKSDLELRTEEYDVIEEGTADEWSNDLGVTQAAPLTDTNLDTTTSFSILGMDAPADSTALPEDPALAGRLGGAITTAPAGPAGSPPSSRAPASRTPAADAPPPSRPAEPPRRETPRPPAATRPAQAPREPAPTTTRQAAPAEEPAPRREPPREPEPAPEPEPTPPTTTRTDTAPPPGPAEPAPDPPHSDDASSEDSPARR